MALHSRDEFTVSAAVATRSRADCSSMEDHTSLSTALVYHDVRMYDFYGPIVPERKYSSSSTVGPY